MRKTNCITTPKNSGGKNSSKEFITFIILGENHGHRMKSYGPVSLVRVGDKTILEKQIETIKSCFLNYEIIVCAGFESKKITSFVKLNFKNYRIRIVENQVHFNSNCCESARLCINNTMNNKLMIINGGVFMNQEHFRLIKYEDSCIITQDSNSGGNLEVSAISHNNSLESLCLGIKNNYWAEVLYLPNENTINKFYNIVSNIDFKNKFMFEAINELSQKSRINVCKNTHNNIIKINDLKTLKGLT